MVKRVVRRCSQGFVQKLELLLQNSLGSYYRLKSEVPNPLIANAGIKGSFDSDCSSQVPKIPSIYRLEMTGLQ